MNAGRGLEESDEGELQVVEKSYNKMGGYGSDWWYLR